MTFSKLLIYWYLQQKRDLPWRNTNNPYPIWLSEIMLQQTRVAQGLPYFERFMEAFPTVKDLADAPLEHVLKLWQGLGYYSRARNLHITAQKVAYEMEGVFPDTYIGLLELKGIGDYTASAIASICYNEPCPVVDGNVYRVLARYFGVDTPINTTAGVSCFKELATSVMEVKNIGIYNQAIMEFGAIQCKPQNPDCSTCVLNENCVALSTKKVSTLPVKLRKSKIKNRYFHYWVIKDLKGNTLLKQRLSKGIWQGLYEFPLYEVDGPVDMNHVLKEVQKEYPTVDRIYSFNDSPIIHKLSHQHLYTTFWVVPLQYELPEAISMQDINTYPVPVLIANFIDEILDY
ncbi:A/G-specific adenine glycosylase [Imtechella halotolerans]|uniref:Adenine DNA glycosylase n=1 Tax=Imtechella halotolerans K1 TaxID=946077 RepID=I0WK07_9FLAO|nr:A/G-specific adenine glycosylase [Imtechella halotolerans]EID76723.1 A/G-specific adenine glycosylase [Imtechella halotolerans K1]WMQ62710.1 A/G-specific adenine glycosylase [Imtechella halotolerans]